MKYLHFKTKPAASLHAVLTVVMAFVCHAVLATEQQQDAYRMAAISDAAYGEDLISGEYERAINELGGKRVRLSERFTVHNNLCVAYVLAKDLDNAARACEVAVRTGTNGQIPKHLAVALTNRGVIHALNGDTVQARRDFKAATKARRSLSEPIENLARLESRERAVLGSY